MTKGSSSSSDDPPSGQSPDFPAVPAGAADSPVAHKSDLKRLSNYVHERLSREIRQRGKPFNQVQVHLIDPDGAIKHVSCPAIAGNAPMALAMLMHKVLIAEDAVASVFTAILPMSAAEGAEPAVLVQVTARRSSPGMVLSSVSVRQIEKNLPLLPVQPADLPHIIEACGYTRVLPQSYSPSAAERRRARECVRFIGDPNPMRDRPSHLN